MHRCAESGPITAAVAQKEALELGLELHRIAHRLARLNSSLPVDHAVVRDITARRRGESPPTLEFEIQGALGTAKEQCEEAAGVLLKASKTNVGLLRARFFKTTQGDLPHE